jgi:cation diffusion facilitator family transporter
MKTKKKFSLVPEYGDINDANIRAKYGYLEALISIFGNLCLFIIKLTLALFINSIALAADAVHSLSDISTSGIVIFGFKIAKKQPDKKHPFGHGRAEHIATLIIAVLLIVIGFNFIQRSIQRIVNPEDLTNPEFAIITAIIIIITSIIKELMARYANRISKKIDSDMLKADSWHHRTDAISSIGVAIGILGAHFGFPILDAFFGIIISLIIMYIGIKLIKTSSDYLIGIRAKEEVIQKLKEITQKSSQVTDIHSIYVHDYGHIKILTFHATMNGSLSLEEAHRIADKLEEDIRKSTHYFPVIHVEPTGIHNKTKEST